MKIEEKQFYSIDKDKYNQVLETDSYIYRYYVTPVKKNIGLFYDKLLKQWDAAYIKNGMITTFNLKANPLIHQLAVKHL